MQRYAFRIGLAPERLPHETPSFPFVFDEVIGIELTNTFEFDALLGMDILGQCDFSTGQAGNCLLSFG